MAETTRPTQSGTAGASPVSVNLLTLQHGAPKKVHLTSNYAMAHPPGFPTPPDMTGCAAANLYTPRTIASGQTVSFIGPEADAIVTAGGGTYA